MPADTLLTAARNYLKLGPTHYLYYGAHHQGASGRTIIRLKPEGYPTYIGIHYTLDRKDNANYLPVSQFLSNAGFNVPEVIYDNPGRRVALVEDLGDTDLLSMKDEPWEVTRAHLPLRLRTARQTLLHPPAQGPRVPAAL